MKKDVHPNYNSKAEVECACGAKFAVGSTNDKISIEICSACHPFFSGAEKVIDTAGRVEKFKARRASATGAKKKKTPAKKSQSK